MVSAPYYQDDRVTLWHGDARGILPTISGYSAVVTDPPYGVAYESNNGQRVANDHDFTTAIDVAAKLDRSVPWVMFANHASLARTLALVGGAHARVRVGVWHKANVNGGAPGNPWLADVEFFVAGVPEWPGAPVSALVSASRSTGNPAWQTRNPEAYLHPTQKPVGAMRHVLRAIPGAHVVLDPFAGSGSTLVAARDLGRKAIGVELDERYCEIAARRLSQEVLDLGALA